eukprot:Lankesteria_metandrocarpae@DN6095_c0_g1_i1.p1
MPTVTASRTYCAQLLLLTLALYYLIDCDCVKLLLLQHQLRCAGTNLTLWLSLLYWRPTLQSITCSSCLLCVSVAIAVYVATPYCCTPPVERVHSKSALSRAPVKYEQQRDYHCLRPPVNKLGQRVKEVKVNGPAGTNERKRDRRRTRGHEQQKWCGDPGSGPKQYS